MRTYCAARMILRSDPMPAVDVATIIANADCCRTGAVQGHGFEVRPRGPGMSLPKNDRNFRSESGKTFHVESIGNGLPFADAIAAALLLEWGQTRSALKEMGRVTRTNQRTVRNWVDGRNGPSGENLVALMRHSDEVPTTVLELSRRLDLVPASSLMSLRPALVRTVNAIDRCQGRG